MNEALGLLLALGIGLLFGAFNLPGPIIPSFWASFAVPAMTIGYLIAKRFL